MNIKTIIYLFAVGVITYLFAAFIVKCYEIVKEDTNIKEEKLSFLMRFIYNQKEEYE